MRIIPTKKRGAEGIFLVDCLTYIGLLAILLGLALMAFYTISDHSRRLAENAADISRVLHGGERWRKDIRSATAAPSIVRDGEEVILRVPQAEGEIQYSYRNGAVYRLVTARTNEIWQLVLAGAKSSRMEIVSPSGVPAWRWEIELATKQKVARVKPLFTFQAVVGFQPSL